PTRAAGMAGGARSFSFASRRRHTRFSRDWSSDVCSSDLGKDTVQKNKDGSDSDKLLNDRPPLRLKAVVRFADGRQYPLTVIAAQIGRAPRRQRGQVARDRAGPHEVRARRRRESGERQERG